MACTEQSLHTVCPHDNDIETSRTPRHPMHITHYDPMSVANLIKLHQSLNDWDGHGPT